MAQAPILSQKGSAVLLEVRLVPRASSCRVMGPYNGQLKVAVCAPPIDGRANSELIHFLAKILSLPKSSFSIERGQKSHDKSVAISSVSLELVKAKLSL